MENAYGIGITNRYALFLDEEADPLEIIKQGDQEKLAAKTKKIETATKPAAKAPVKANKNDADKENNQRNNRFDGKKVFDARKPADGPREERNNQRNRDNDVRRDDDGERRGGMGRGGGRGRGGPGAGRGRGGPAGAGGRGGKREFDRKSGDTRTGIKAEEKRGGSGKGNWGNFEDDVKAEGDEPTNTSVEEAPQDAEATENKEEVEEKEPVSDEPKTLTLDEWKAQQGKKEGPKFNVRKAGEGSEIDPKWKKATIYKKENEEESEEEEEEEVVYLQRANRQKKVTDINFTFADESRGGGGRGRGGRGRGGRGRDDRDRGDRDDRRGDGPRRGGPRGDARGPRGGGGSRGGKKEFNLNNDMKDFPTLG